MFVRARAGTLKVLRMVSRSVFPDASGVAHFARVRVPQSELSAGQLRAAEEQNRVMEGKLAEATAKVCARMRD